MDKQSSYGRSRERLEEIVTQIKAKDLPLEKSLDLYEEALRLGAECAEMIDRTDFSAEELGDAVFEDEDAGEAAAAGAAGGAAAEGDSEDETSEDYDDEEQLN